MEEFKRFIRLINENGFKNLQNSNVLIFGIGGVGGYVCEALVRSGIEHFTLVDHDVVSLSNMNRQIIALHSTVSSSKVDVMKQRMLDINPNCQIETKQMFYLPENEKDFHFEDFDYIIDCIDTITAKLNIIEKATQLNIPVISSMGAGNRMDPTCVEICDIYKTYNCALSKVMRRELKKRGIKKCKVAFSKELAIQCQDSDETEKKENNRRSIPASSAFVPPAFGLAIASAVVCELAGLKK